MDFLKNHPSIRRIWRAFWHGEPIDPTLHCWTARDICCWCGVYRYSWMTYIEDKHGPHGGVSVIKNRDTERCPDRSIQGVGTR